MFVPLDYASDIILNDWKKGWGLGVGGGGLHPSGIKSAAGRPRANISGFSEPMYSPSHAILA